MNPQKILIVEDDPAIGQSLLDGLKHHGFEAYLCTSGASGVEYAKRNLPHLVILDVRLPDGSG
ncbi:MAG: response regulator, partial [Chloroflexota bacterium]|nr:response regulator [Chloroflexota bacterium]